MRQICENIYKNCQLVELNIFPYIGKGLGSCRDKPTNKQTNKQVGPKMTSLPVVVMKRYFNVLILRF